MKHILEHFKIENAVEEPQPLKIGIINDSYVVRAKEKGQPSYFLQRINHHIFENVEGLQRNIEVVTNHIRRKLEERGEPDIERKVLQLIPTQEGKLYYRTEEGDYWRVYVLIENAFSQEKVTPETAELTGEAFGRFQCQLADLPFNELCESIPNFHNIEFRLQQLDDAIAADSVGRVKACADIIKEIIKHLGSESGVSDLRMKLDSVYVFFGIFKGSAGAFICSACSRIPFRQSADKIRMAHPYYAVIGNILKKL